MKGIDGVFVYRRVTLVSACFVMSLTFGCQALTMVLVTARCQRGSVLRSELHTCCRQIRSQAVADRERSTFTRSEVRF